MAGTEPGGRVADRGIAAPAKSHCSYCGGTGQIKVQTDPTIWDVCLVCEDQWCRDRRCYRPDGSMPHHLTHTIRKAAA